MSLAATCVLLPWAGAVLAAMLARSPLARWLQAATCGATLASVLSLWRADPSAGWLADPLTLGACTLATAAALAGSVAGLRTPNRTLVPAAALALLGSILLGLLADSATTAWLATASALATATAASLLAHPAGRAAARAMAPPAAGALAAALLGTLLLAAGGATRWSLPPDPADPALLSLGSVLLLCGYGLAAGLAPLHGWLGRAQDSAPPDLRVLLCAPLPALALVLLLRVATVAAGALPAGTAPTALLVSGLLSTTLAGLALWRGPPGGTLRLATLLHGGLAATAFGLDGGGAAAAGLLILAVSGLARVSAALAGKGGWLARLAVLALAGAPPLALFGAEFLLLADLLARRPWLAAVTVFGLATAAAGLLRRGLDEPGGGRLARGTAWTVLAAAMLLGWATPEGLTRAAETLAGH